MQSLAIFLFLPVLRKSPFGIIKAIHRPAILNSFDNLPYRIECLVYGVVHLPDHGGHRSLGDENQEKTRREQGEEGQEEEDDKIRELWSLGHNEDYGRTIP